MVHWKVRGVFGISEGCDMLQVSATTPTTAARGPTSSGRVAGFWRKGHDEGMDQGVGDSLAVAYGTCGYWIRGGLGVGWRAAAVSGDGTGYAGSSATSGV